MHQNASGEIKHFAETSQLRLPDNRGCFRLYCNISFSAASGILHQIQSGKLKLTEYASKSLPSTAETCSIIEMSGLAINIASFKLLLTKVNFACTVDYVALILVSDQVKWGLKTVKIGKSLVVQIKGVQIIWSCFCHRETNVHHLKEKYT